MAKKDQHNVGTPLKRRGQQMGTAGARDQNRQEMADTPALRGQRKYGNKFFADDSSQHMQSDATKPKSNRPSVPAMVSADRKGLSGGESTFKARLKKKRASKTRSS